MKLDKLELKAFRDGTLTHCGESVIWETCHLHRTDDQDCLLALCAGECEGEWCDTFEFGDNN